jgi:RNA polymerase sigma-70 factor (ECF subfamily)
MLEAAIDELPENFPLVFLLRAVEEMGVAETAEALEVPEETVKTRLHCARALLRRSLDHHTQAATPTVFSFHLSRCDRVVSAVLARIATKL